MSPILDPDIARALQQRVVPPEALVSIAIGNVTLRRQLHESALALTDTSITPGISIKDFHVPSADGTPILCRWYHLSSGANKSGSTAGVIYFHGGGHILGNVPLFDGVCSRYVANTSVPVLSVAYRLSPEHPFPFAVDDAYAALCWLHGQGSSVMVDSTRIAVMGDSAGGGLAAALAHYTLHNNGPKIAKQILIYPMLDDRTTFTTLPAKFLTWTLDDNMTAWNALLGTPSTRANDLPAWAAPARMHNAPTGLPSVYIEIAELDLFREEDEDYARRLKDAGVEVEIKTRKGCLHGWEHIAPEAKVTMEAFEDRWRVIRNL
jgi:acetyl esterase/lipase